ncbi:hypothetical protein HY486_04010 [Candidatus Woesearchaeota archaeon]|nr:hypothetical protein [Candidatus Woesearchaeota archaeon]
MKLLAGLVAVILVISIVQAFTLGSIKNASPANPEITSSGKLDMSSWTEDEKMGYEHHGTLPSRLQGLQGLQGNSAPQMVGGC